MFELRKQQGWSSVSLEALSRRMLTRVRLRFRILEAFFLLSFSFTDEFWFPIQIVFDLLVLSFLFSLDFTLNVGKIEAMSTGRGLKFVRKGDWWQTFGVTQSIWVSQPSLRADHMNDSLYIRLAFNSCRGRGKRDRWRQSDDFEPPQFWSWNSRFESISNCWKVILETRAHLAETWDSFGLGLWAGLPICSLQAWRCSLSSLSLQDWYLQEEKIKLKELESQLKRSCYRKEWRKENSPLFLAGGFGFFGFTSCKESGDTSQWKTYLQF